MSEGILAITLFEAMPMLNSQTDKEVEAVEAKDGCKTVTF
jgi:hypothetical protein